MGRCIQKIGVKCYFLGALLQSVGILLEYVGTLQFLPNFCLILADFLLRKKLGGLRRFIPLLSFTSHDVALAVV